METIDFEIKKKKYLLPNAWTKLSQAQFVHLSGLLRLHVAGLASVGDVRLGYVTHFLGIDITKVSAGKAALVATNLYTLLQNVDFIFNIKYSPDVWNNLSPETRRLAIKTEPSDLPDTPEVRYLRTCDYKFVIDAVFAAQLIPQIAVGRKKYKGYEINTRCGELSCSLTARQYIDASERLSRVIDNPGLLPLLAAILYCPGRYDSDWAHRHAADFAALSPETLEAIALNFQSFVIFLFEKTHYTILRQKNAAPSKGLYVGMSEGLYNLSTDGYGNLEEVGRLSVIEYLDILRKKLIESVRTMHASDMKTTEIASKTGLDMNTINKILQ